MILNRDLVMYEARSYERKEYIPSSPVDLLLLMLSIIFIFSKSGAEMAHWYSAGLQAG
jgi:hypothetical protein